eukprot:2632351-Amphidinium_carterae.1
MFVDCQDFSLAEAVVKTHHLGIHCSGGQQVESGETLPSGTEQPALEDKSSRRQLEEGDDAATMAVKDRVERTVSSRMQVDVSTEGRVSATKAV